MIEDENILDWFKKNNQKMPNLSKIAMKYLIIPATSASSERLFSKAGRIYSPLRCSLSYKTGQVLIFLRGNAEIASKRSQFNKDFPDEPTTEEYSALNLLLDEDTIVNDTYESSLETDDEN